MWRINFFTLWQVASNRISCKRKKGNCSFPLHQGIISCTNHAQSEVIEEVVRAFGHRELVGERGVDSHLQSQKYNDTSVASCMSEERVKLENLLYLLLCSTVYLGNQGNSEHPAPVEKMCKNYTHKNVYYSWPHLPGCYRQVSLYHCFWTCRAKGFCLLQDGGKLL